MITRCFPAVWRAGFTLVELSVVVIIIGLLSAAAVGMGKGKIEEARDYQTREKLEQLEKALMAYRKSNNRLPCPASLTLPPGDTNYGRQAANPGRCLGGTPEATHSKLGVEAVEGGVPFQDLKLGEEFMYDGWHRRLVYAVDTRMTEYEAFEVYDIYDNCGNITVKDGGGGTRTSAAIYALLSLGSNGHGGYLDNGTRLSAHSADTDELRNCNCDTDAVDDGSYDPLYVEKPADSAFDDTVRYKERWQMRLEDDSAAMRYNGPEVAISGASPYVSFYSKACDAYTRMADPDTMPTGPGHGVAVSPNDNYWAVAHDNSPYITLYKRDGTTGALTKLANPATLPGGNATSAAFSPTGKYLAVGNGHPVDSLYLHIYKINAGTDTFTYLPAAGGVGPNVQPASKVTSVAFSPGDFFLAAGHGTAPNYINIYAKPATTADLFTLLASGKISGGKPAGPVTGAAFSPDGRYLAVAHANDPFVSLYAVNNVAQTFTRLTVPDALTTDATSVAFDRKSRYLAVTTANDTQSLYVYKITDTGGVALVSGTNITYNAADAAAFSPRQNNLVLAGPAFTYHSVIKFMPTDHVFTLRQPIAIAQPADTATGVAIRRPVLRAYLSGTSR